VSLRGGSPRYLMGVDLGSSSIRAVVYDTDGNVVGLASRPMEKEAPDAARPDHIVWPHERVWRNAASAIREALALLPQGATVDALAVACLGMDGLPVDAEQRELYPFISWHDARTMPQFDAWQAGFGAKRQFLTTGNQLYPFNTAFRLQWMAENEPAILAKAHKWVLMGDYLNMRLCGRIATDYSMASCTLLFDPGRARWSDEVVAAAGVDPRLLCEPLPSGTILGPVSKAAAEATGLVQGTPVVLGGHDYLCGVLPVGGHVPGTMVNVVGTWDVTQTTLPGFNPSETLEGRGLTVEAHVAAGQYSVYGAAIGGAVVDWYRGNFGSHGRIDWASVAADAAAVDPDLLFLPHIAGATCPVFDPLSAGALVGLRTSHTQRDILAAVFQGLAFQGSAIAAALRTAGIQWDRHVVVGGGGKNQAFNQLKADVTGTPIEVPDVAESTALGAAMLAGVAIGVFQSLEDAYGRVRRTGAIYQPRPETARRLERKFKAYASLHDALAETNHALAHLGTP
jgi:xylulokinase